jgi:hypothetical protein
LDENYAAFASAAQTAQLWLLSVTHRGGIHRW